MLLENTIYHYFSIFRMNLQSNIILCFVFLQKDEEHDHVDYAPLTIR